MTIHDFDAIRPYESAEIPAAVDALFGDAQFQAVAQPFLGGVPVEAVRQKARGCPSLLELQKTLIYPLVKQLAAPITRGYEMDASTIAPEARREGSFTFVSNHRDIVIDPALLSILLLDNGFRTTPEIAIGDNLLIYPWIKTLVRLNKTFIVQRSVGIREMLASSKRMSDYMHFAIGQKHENIWIAQREGRAKDSDDRTQESVLKMMAMGGEGSVIDRLKALHIVPLTISYELDPCDYLKAEEMQQKRDNPDYKKTMQADLENMQTGIFGMKGHVHYRLGQPMDEWIDDYAHLQKQELFRALGARMDREIHQGYEIFPDNYVALDLLNGTDAEAAHYTPADKQAFEAYLADRLDRIALADKDVPFLRNRMLTMYANPLINYRKAHGEASRG